MTGVELASGWEIHQDPADDVDTRAGLPWSLWHHGEYVGNYPTRAAARSDAVPMDCGKCGAS